MSITINGTTGIAGVDGSAGTPALQGNDTNTGIAFGTDVILASTGGSERWRVDSAGRLLVGTSAARASGNSTPQFQIEGGNVNTAALSIIVDDNTTIGSSIYLGKSRGSTIGSTTIVQSGDILGSVAFMGTDGAVLTNAATIYGQVDGAPGANSMPGRIVLSTTASGASSPTERMRIDSAGNTLFISGSTVLASGFFAVPGETGTTPVKAFSLYEAGKSNISYPGQWRVYTSSGQGSVFKPGFYLHLRNYDAGTAAESGDLFQFRGNGGLANFSANDVNLSDVRSKKDITPVAGFWDCLKQWEIVNYRYKEQPDDADLNIGVIAQQVAENCPEVVAVFQDAIEATDTEPGQEERLGVKEQQMMWMAIKALQEALERIETLEAKVAALEATP